MNRQVIMFFRLCICLGACLWSSVAMLANLIQEPIEFAIVIPSYNNEKWCLGNIASCFNQTYPYFKIYYVNDCSKDRTGELVESYVKSRGLGEKCTIIHNKERRGCPLANLDTVIRTLDPKKVVVVDGDDKLAHPRVLETLAAIYANGKTWITYGNYKSEPFVQVSLCMPIPLDVQQKNSFRKYPWVTSHLRTFYAGLFQRIKQEDLIWKGRFFPMAGDLASTYPMLEMASRGHIKFINEVLYLYNLSNPISEFRVNVPLVLECENYIRSKSSYAPLEELF